MKPLILVPFLLLCLFIYSGCTYYTVLTPSISAKNLPIDGEKADDVVQNTDRVTKAIARAIKKQDYRLLATSTRSMNIPGVNSADYKVIVTLCGKKYSTGVGDVIISENQRLTRKTKIAYMREYNKRMLVICHKIKQ